MRFNSPPGWPTPPDGWNPPADWTPDPSWPAPPPGWKLWLEEADDHPSAPVAPPTPDGPDVAEEVHALRRRVRELENQLAQSESSQVVDVNEQRVLQDVGIYRYSHPLDSSPAYKERLAELNRRMDDMVKSGTAIESADMFTWNGSLANGRKLVRDLGKLMLRAYNAEADNCVRALRNANVQTASKRLDRSAAAIEKLGSMMEMRINPAFHMLRIEELLLVADYQVKVQEERERAREEREMLREQRRAEAELKAERERLDKEREHYITVLARLREAGDESAARDLESRLQEIDQAIESNDYRIANVRAGYVYVISNVGAFGPDMVKIGMTRRLEPTDRIRELGDASVPFLYDTHALFFSEDAVTLENELHRAFAERRVNWVNSRREFFFATPEEVRTVLSEKIGGLLEYHDVPDALEYVQSRSSWPPDVRPKSL